MNTNRYITTVNMYVSTYFTTAQHTGTIKAEEEIL